MGALVMIFILVCAAVLQAILPTWTVLGNAVFPILPGLVFYYALTRPSNIALCAAMIAGLLQDAMCMVPLGYSAFCFSLVSLLISKFREEILIVDWSMHFIFGAITNAAITLALYLLLLIGNFVHISMFTLVMKLSASLLLGALVIPIIFKIVFFLDCRLGIMVSNES
jgi:rod shape-determining protein MreD